MKKKNLPPLPPVPLPPMQAAQPETLSDLPTIDDDLLAKITEIRKLQGLKFKDKHKVRRKPSKAFLITMRYSNGTRRSFIITTTKETFKHRKGLYYLYYENAFFDISNGLYHLDYFDDYCCPIDREIIKKVDKDAPVGQERAYFTVTPHNLRPLLAMEYVKSLAQSQELNKYLKMTLLFSIVSIAIGVVILIKLLRP